LPDQRPTVLAEALAAARKIGLERYQFDDGDNPSAWPTLLSEWKKLPGQQSYSLWITMLREGAEQHRQGLLAELRCLLPIIESLGGETALMETFCAIEDVGKWWP
jgi:hypothetical protein